MIYLITFLFGLLIGTFLRYQDYPIRLLEWVKRRNYKKEKLPNLVWKTRRGDKLALTERLIYTSAKTAPNKEDVAEYRSAIVNKFLKKTIDGFINFI